ncbi:ATP-binding protein [Candidatus Oscillochloris fontis]|uniref:ATP-binding protein n=1 Tax=Candidatus Oscillochloris fontis TaxID=2496868 RepID=UPI00101D24D0|nr:ATP-binding protein [Candidatus Oscillochloris fontis]
MLARIKSRLQYKLMLGFSAVLLVALTLVSAYTQYSASEMLLSYTRDEQRNLTNARIAVTQGLLNEIRNDLLFLTRDPAIATFMTNNNRGDEITQRFMRLLSRSGSRYQGVCVVDHVGAYRLCVGIQDGQATLIPNTSYLPAAEALPPSDLSQVRDIPHIYSWTFTQPIPNTNQSEMGPIVRFSSAIYAQSGTNIGQIILDTSAESIFNLLIEPEQGTQTFITDQNGNYILGGEGNLRDDRPQSGIEILNQYQGTLIDPPDYRNMFSNYATLRFPDQRSSAWIVIYDRPVEQILAPIRQSILVNVILTIVLLIVGLVISYLLTRSIVRPMRALAMAAERVGSGDLQTPITTTSHDEIGALADTLDHTVTRLRTSIENADMRRREAETLYRTAIALNSTLDLHQLLNRILQELRAVVPYDSSTVQLVRDDHVEIIGAYGLAKLEELIGETFPLHGPGPNAEVARRQATVILDDAPQAYSCFNEEPYRNDPIRSWMGVPLIFGERLIGMITIDKYEPNFYSPEHARIANAFAAQAAIALENARLYEAIRTELAERLRAEDQLRQAQKMEAVGRLAGGVSHDFNNILTVIMGECDLIMHEPDLKPDIRQGLDQIYQAGMRASALTRQLLAFSRRQILQPIQINLNEIIIPIEKMLRRLIGEDINLHTQLDPNLNTIRADPSQIEQVILNLCINARDAMPQGGELAIITENVHIEVEFDHDLPTGNYVLLSISDTGSGIDAHIREHIFEPFFTTKPRGKGTGLGLATVHGIVQQSGGIIRFQSVLGQGTCFSVYIPVVHEHPQRISPVSPHQITYLNAVVLLVEDDERVRQLTEQILRSHGLKVITAANGTAALRVCAEYQDRIDLLLTDIIMPGGINGIQLAERIRLSHPHISILLMSGYNEEAFTITDTIRSENLFLQKPFTPGILIAKVAESLAKQIPAAP